MAALLGALFEAAASPGESHARAVMRVAPSGVDAPDCGTVATSCRTIQQAVNRIATGGTVLVVGSPGGGWSRPSAESSRLADPDPRPDRLLVREGAREVRVVCRGDRAPAVVEFDDRDRAREHA